MESDIRTPTPAELSSLPRRAAAAFAARFGRRLFLIVNENLPDAFDQATAAQADSLLRVAESLAACSHMRDWPGHQYFRSSRQRREEFGKLFKPLNNKEIDQFLKHLAGATEILRKIK